MIKRTLAHSSARFRLLELLNFVKGVVVGAHASVVDLLEPDNHGVADAALVNRHNLASLAVPVRFRAQDANLHTEK